MIIHRAEKALGGTICEDCAIKDAKKLKREKGARAWIRGGKRAHERVSEGNHETKSIDQCIYVCFYKATI